MLLTANNINIDLKIPCIMGILNLTDDSFSDGGEYNTPIQALARAKLMVEQGAKIIDVGAESSRPSSVPISAKEEINKLLPTLKMLLKELPVAISVDTYKAEVMQAVIDLGVHIINDIYALQQPNVINLLAKNPQIAIVIMHMLGTPTNMQNSPKYKSVVKDVNSFFESRINKCLEYNINKKRLIIDPGFGFGKNLNDNLKLLNKLASFSHFNLPILVGLSRKSMLGEILSIREPKERINASVIAALFAYKKGANIIRCHDVKQTIQALKLTDTIKSYNYE